MPRHWVPPIDPEYARVLEAQAEANSVRVSAEEAARLEKPCPCPPTYLYLVSAEKKGVQYWKAGITEKEDPIKRAPKFYREVFRKKQFSWKKHAQDVETTIARHFRELNRVAERDGYEITKPPTKEGLAYEYSLEVALEVFDWWVDLAATSDRVKYYFRDESESPAYIFTGTGFLEPEHFAWINYSKYAYADLQIRSFSYWHKKRKNAFRHALDCYLRYNDYFLEGTEERPYPSRRGVGVFCRSTRADIHYLFGLIDWLDPHINRLTKFRPDRKQAVLEPKEPEWK